MTDLMHHDRTSSELSSVTRLADAARNRVTACSCDTPAVTVLRGFDASSRRRAAALRARLRGEGVLTTVAAAPMVNAHHHGPSPLVPPARVDGHLCVLVDATVGGRLEVDRIAGWTSVPLVALAPRGRRPTTEVRSMLRVSFPDAPGKHVPFPSASGRVVGIAFDNVLVAPNQPGTGQLRLRMPGDPPQELPAGAAVRFGVLDDSLHVVADPPGAQPEQVWITAVVHLEQVSGLHTVRRDGLLVADVDTTVELVARPAGLVTDYA